MSRRPYTTALREPEAPFLNRQCQLGQITGHVGALQEDPEHFKVLEVIGIGGAGKSRLLRHVQKTALGEDDAPRARAIFISLEEERSTTETGPLLAIREQIGTECLLFDTALLAYWRASGQPLDLQRSDRLADSLVVSSLELGAGATGLVPLLPLAFGIRAFRYLKELGVKLSRYQPEEFEYIDELQNQTEVLRERLPYYLGLDIERATESDPALVVFYDGYDRQAVETRAEKAQWLRYFIGTLERGIHIVSTRDPLLWDEGDWGDTVETVAVKELPDSEVRKMIRNRLGDIDAAFVARLIEASGHIPFFVETVIQGYERVCDQPQLTVDDLPSSPDGALNHLLKHLEADERELALALGTVQVFDEGIYADLLDELKLKFSRLRFQQFIKWFFVEEISPEKDSLALYKTHDVLTASVHGSPADALSRRMCLEAATNSLLRRCGDGARKNPEAILPIFRAVIAGWYSADMPLHAVETLIDAAYLLYDAGYWNELASMVSEAEIESELPIAVVSEFFIALTTRRTEGIGPAVRRFSNLGSRASALGRHEQSAELELAYLREIAGDYAGARREFRELAAATTGFDPSDRTQRRSRMYHADMLIMDGQFVEAARLFHETYEEIGPGAIVDWGEMVRLRGHAYRFSFMLERAGAFYTEAMRAAVEAPGLRGKLHTNLAESYCWCDPESALEEAELSIELNRTLGNEIELAKCGAAQGIALARIGEKDAAEMAIGDARERAEGVGYPAGVAFALQAKAVAAGLAGDIDCMFEAAEELTKMTEELKTYTHLLLAPKWLMRDEIGFAQAAAGADWFEPDQLEHRLRGYLAP